MNERTVPAEEVAPTQERGGGEPRRQRGVPTPLDRARELAPEIAAASDEIERERRLPERLVRRLIEAGLFRMLLPRGLDGAELDPLDFLAVIETIAQNDASTAWCLCQNSVAAMVAAFLMPEAARRIFGDANSILAWGPGPGSRAVAVEGGYRVTGRWSFASGIRHASWLGGYCQIVEPDGTPRRGPDGAALGRTMLFPAPEAVLSDVWNVVGLRGTASDAFAVDDLFVPEAHSVARDDPAERRYAVPLYRLRTDCLFACGFASVALALARAMVDAFTALALEKTPRGYKSALRNSEVIQAQLAECEARLRAGRMYLRGTLGEVWQGVRRSDTLTLDQRMAIRLAASQAIQEAIKVADTVYHSAGATSIFTSNPFERRFRDIHTLSQQMQGRRWHFETVGKHLLGLPAETTFL